MCRSEQDKNFPYDTSQGKQGHGKKVTGRGQ